MTKDECEECQKQKKKYSQDHSKPKNCRKHQCPVEVAPGRRCTHRKSATEDHCSAHRIPRCTSDGCRSKTLEGSLSLYCIIHTCLYRGCRRGAKPGDGMDFCEDHKCDDPACQLPKKPVLHDGQIVSNQFCRSHECLKLGCKLKKLPEKGYCLTHACTAQGCQNERDQELPLCLKHHDEDVEQNAEERARLRWEREQQEKAKEKQAEEEEDRRVREQALREAKEKLKEEQEMQEKEENRRRARNTTNDPSSPFGGATFGTSPSTGGIRTPRSSGEYIYGESEGSPLPKRTGSHHRQERPARSPPDGDTHLRPEDPRTRRMTPSPTGHDTYLRPELPPRPRRAPHETEYQPYTTASMVSDAYLQPRQQDRDNDFEIPRTSKDPNPQPRDRRDVFEEPTTSKERYSQPRNRQDTFKEPRTSKGHYPQPRDRNRDADFETPRTRPEYTYTPQERTAPREIPIVRDRYGRPIVHQTRGEASGGAYVSTPAEEDRYGQGPDQTTPGIGNGNKQDGLFGWGFKL